MSKYVNLLVDFFEKKGIKMDKGTFIIRISYIVRNITAIVFVLLELERKIKIDYLSYFGKFHLWDGEFASWLYKATIGLLVIWLIREQLFPFIADSLRKFINKTTELCKEQVNEIMALGDMLVDLIDLIFSILYFLNVLNALIMQENQKQVNVTLMEFFSVGYLICMVGGILYNKNRDIRDKISKQFTNYCDWNGERIQDGATVIYYNKLYEIEFAAYTTYNEAKQEFTQNTWILKSKGNNGNLIDKVISLEDAVHDEKGRLMVYKKTYFEERNII